MTDNELRELVAGLAVSQAKTDDELKAFLSGVAASQAKLDAQMAKTDAQMSKTEAQMARTDKKLERIGIRMGNISDNNGATVEDYFFNSLGKKPELGGVKYDTIVKNFLPTSKRGQGEFDIVMFNGENLALIECKYKAHISDVEKLITKQVASFKQLFPIYANHHFYLGIASFSFYPELEKFAKENGVAILKQKGDIVVIEATDLKAY